MILGVGSDIVEVSRIKRLMLRYPKGLHRVFTQAEQDYAFSTPQPAHALAKRFAAKEAVVKALGVGFRHGITLTSVEVVNDALGKPVVRLHPPVVAWIEARFGPVNACRIHLSLSDEKNSALAFVVIESINAGDAACSTISSE